MDRDAKKVEYEYWLGWLLDEKKLVMLLFSTTGYFGRRIGTHAVATKTWKSKETGVWSDGQPYSYDQETKQVNDKSFGWAGMNFQVGGKQQPTLKATFTRK